MALQCRLQGEEQLQAPPAHTHMTGSTDDARMASTWNCLAMRKSHGGARLSMAEQRA